jgi:lysozyme
MMISEAGLNLIRTYEGLRLSSYQDGRGIWTIGYGHTGPDVKPGMTITEQEANELLIQDAQTAEEAVDRLVKVGLSQGMFDALCDFVFNIGETAFAHSTLLAKLNAGDYMSAPSQIREWCHVDGKVSQGLLARRNAEVALWYS